MITPEQIQAELERRKSEEAPAPPPEGTSISRSVPERVLKTIDPYVKPALQMGGGVVGGMVSSPSMVGTAAGAALGYAGGGQLGDIYEAWRGITPEKEGMPRDIPGSMKKQMTELATDLPVGFAADLGGQYTMKALNAGIKKLPTLAANMYKWVTKPSKTIPIKDVESGVQMALEKGVPVSEKGIEMARTAEKDISSQIDNIAAELTRSGKKGSTIKILNRLDDLEKDALSGTNVERDLAKIRAFRRRAIKEHGYKMTPTEMQAAKKKAYEEVITAKKQAYTTNLNTIETEMKQAWGRGLKEELGDMFVLPNGAKPIAELNENSAAWINLKKILKDAVSRERNKYPFGLMEATGGTLGGIYGGSKGGYEQGGRDALMGVLLAKAIRSPLVMKQIAHILYKAGQKEIPAAAGRAGAFGITDALRGSNRDPLGIREGE